MTTWNEKSIHDFELVTMLPVRRGGTNLFRRLLNSQSRIYSPFPTHLDEFLDITHIYGHLGNEQNFFEMIVHFCTYMNARTFRQGGIQLDPYDVFDGVVKNGLPHNVISAAWETYRMEAAAVKPTATVLMEKSVGVIKYWRELMETFQGRMKFIILLRNPIDQVSSMTKAQVYDFHPLLNALFWATAHQSTEELMAEYPEKCCAIRFEDLVSDPPAHMARVCDFLGLEFEAEAIAEVDRESRIQAERAPLWQKVAAPPDKSIVGKGKTGLTAEERELVETICGRFMDKYGYPRTTPGQFPLSEELLDAAKLVNATLLREKLQEQQLSNPKDYLLRKWQRSLLTHFQTMRAAMQ